MSIPAIFFDRDGIVNTRLIDKYVLNIDQFEFTPNFFEVFKLVKSLDYLAILITNQQGIGKKLMTENDLQEIHKFMQEKLIENTGFQFDDIYFCGDLKENNNYRRKPNPGMIFEAVEKFNIDLKNSYFIGDSFSDIVAGKSAGVKTIYVNNDICDFADYCFDDLSKFLQFFQKVK